MSKHDKHKGKYKLIITNPRIMKYNDKKKDKKKDKIKYKFK